MTDQTMYKVYTPFNSNKTDEERIDDELETLSIVFRIFARRGRQLLTMQQQTACAPITISPGAQNDVPLQSSSTSWCDNQSRHCSTGVE